MVIATNDKSVRLTPTPISDAEWRLINMVRDLPYGKVTMYIESYQPQRITVEETIKL